MHRRQPLVSVGIPTYNRGALLRRAIESVLSQDYDNIELVISDNASTDGTQALCEEFSRRDGRVRYYRQPTNQGLTANFRAVFKYSRGQYYKVLGDDDWIDPTYISHCVRELEAQPEVSIVYGGTKWYDNDRFVQEGAYVSLLMGSGKARILEYYKTVQANEPFYGVMRKDTLLAATQMANAFGADWFLVASIAFMGQIKAIDTTSSHMAHGGTSANEEKTARVLGLPRYQARLSYIFITLFAFRDIAWSSPTYESLGVPQRLLLALSVSGVLGGKLLGWSLGNLKLSFDRYLRIIKV